MVSFKFTTLSPIIIKVFVVHYICTRISIANAYVPIEDFFRFNSDDSGTFVASPSDDGFTEVNLTLISRFPLFHQRYRQLFVNTNGAISFDEAQPQITPTCLPGFFVPTITPFWADIITNDEEEHLYFQETRNQTLILKAAREIQRGFPTLSAIRLTWLLITTWFEVPFYGSHRCSGPPLNNTFQVILTSDGTNSFAIFYYNKITWISAENCSGQGGVPAQAGFHTGGADGFYQLPGSCTSGMLNIASRSNINEPGKWIFKIDSDFETPIIIPTTTTTTTTKTPTKTTTTVTPVRLVNYFDNLLTQMLKLLNDLFTG